jgi:D-alanyl-D-alanine-carboxypeptidase/D-alanyl-D-alanine-endopeptidase
MSTLLGVLCSLLLIAIAGCAKEDAPPEQQVEKHFPSGAEIQALIQSRIDEDRAVGMVVGVMEADGSTRIFTAGEAGPGAQPLGAQSVFEIGSITKVFTAILLADMVAKGEVSLDDPVSKYLPEDEVTIPTRGDREIMLLDIATHRSSIPRMPDNFAPADDANPYADYTVEQMFEFLSNLELTRDIGSEAEYSNLAMGLLGHVLARVNGTTYEDLVRERILDPLEMNSSGITLSEDMQQWLALGHDTEGNVVSNWDIPTLAGAGALRSDMNDMLVFIAANTGPALTPLEEVMRDSHEARNNYGGPNEIGLNWIITNQGKDKVVWHSGGTGGYRTFAGFDPDRGVGAVVLTNSSHGSDDIGMHLINANIPLTPAPAEHIEIAVSAEILETYVGDYTLAPNFSIKVRTEDGALFAQATDQPNTQIYPESENEFFYKVVDAQITFEKDDSGNVTGLTLHQNGADMPAPKQ